MLPLELQIESTRLLASIPDALWDIYKLSIYIYFILTFSIFTMVWSVTNR